MDEKRYRSECGSFVGYGSLDSGRPDEWMESAYPMEEIDDDPMEVFDKHLRGKASSDKLAVLQLKLLGIGFVLICIAILFLAKTGASPMDNDVSPVVLFGIIAYKLLTLKEVPPPVDDDPYYEEDER